MANDKPKDGTGRKARSAKTTSAPRRARGFLRASELAPNALKTAGAKRGFAELRLLMEWQAVVGDALSTICRPVKVSYGGRGGPGLGASLIVTAEGARAPEVDMQKTRIIDKVNAFYGYRAISRLVIDQAQNPAQTLGAGFAESTSPWTGPDIGTHVREMPLSDVEDERLGLALSRLEANIKARERVVSDTQSASRAKSTGETDD